MHSSQHHFVDLSAAPQSLQLLHLFNLAHARDPSFLITNIQHVFIVPSWRSAKSAFSLLALRQACFSLLVHRQACFSCPNQRHIDFSGPDCGMIDFSNPDSRQIDFTLPYRHCHVPLTAISTSHVQLTARPTFHVWLTARPAFIKAFILFAFVSCCCSNNTACMILSQSDTFFPQRTSDRLIHGSNYTQPHPSCTPPTLEEHFTSLRHRVSPVRKTYRLNFAGFPWTQPSLQSSPELETLTNTQPASLLSGISRARLRPTLHGRQLRTGSRDPSYSS